MNQLNIIAAVVVFILAAVISFTLTPLIKVLARRWGVVDRPGERKVHTQIVPLLGGWAIGLAFIITVLTTGLMGWLDDGQLSFSVAIPFIMAIIILLIGGSWDDIKNISPLKQFLFPVLAVVIMVGVGLAVDIVTNPLGRGIIYVNQLAWWLPPAVAFFWLLGMTYTTKLLDGLDGLAVSISLVAALVIFVASLNWDIPRSGTALLALALAGVCLGFLPYNWHPAKIFLGEGGSTVLGFILGVLAIISGAKIATAVLVMGLPILDVVWAIIRRTFAGRSPFANADQGHLHHRLLTAGLNQPRAVLTLVVISALFGSLALLQRTAGKLIGLGILIVTMVVLGFLISHIGTRQDKQSHE